MSARQASTRKILNGLLVFLTVVLLLCIGTLAALLYLSDQGSPRATAAAETRPLEYAEPTPRETAATEPVTEPVTEATQPVVIQQPTALTELLETGDITYEELVQLGCTQLVTVVAEGTTAQIGMFSCADGAWEALPQMNCEGFVGRSGVSDAKQEGDGTTPVGLYRIGSGFYIDDMPETALDLFQITEDTYWVDDPNSKFYNQRVESTENKDWNSAEQMFSYAEYTYGFVVNYNVLAQPGAGSAIFFHINDNPTAGCIATEEEMVLAYLKELDKARNPYILILDKENVEARKVVEE